MCIVLVGALIGAVIAAGLEDFIPGLGQTQIVAEISVWENYDKRWEHTSKISWQEVLEIIPQIEHRIENRSNVKVKNPIEIE